MAAMARGRIASAVHGGDRVKPTKNAAKAIKVLNKALGWELRAALMYAHYAAYLIGRDRLDFEELFNGESTESMGHARTVRQIIADLGGDAVTAPDPTPIPHTRDPRAMLEEALRTEAAAEAQYREVVQQFGFQSAWHHALRHVLMAEEKTQIELRRLLAEK
jgi:bacterioferritin (cytochrome b1)